MYNLHVVFTMNPSSEGLKDRAATSPALFNRSQATHSHWSCLLLWSQLLQLQKLIWMANV